VQGQGFNSINVITHKTVRAVWLGLLLAALPNSAVSQNQPASAMREQLSSVPASVPSDITLAHELAHHILGDTRGLIDGVA
jgi:hypothetical protein